MSGTRIRALVAGSGGQLGQSLVRCAPDRLDVVPVAHRDLDITDRDTVRALVGEVEPALVINAAAYTAVDRAESDEERAAKVNRDAVGILADAAREVGARFITVSTDFVFDGESGRAYRPDDRTNPINVYGRTKRDGEELAGPEALVVRTSWVYAPFGQNFLLTMLRLMQERDELKVVADQIGRPTHAADLASAIWDLSGLEATGVHHYANSGVASWYDFAVAIYEEATEIGLLATDLNIVPIATADYPTPAARPRFSVLDTDSMQRLLGRPAPHWRSSLRRALTEIDR
jgi:dTDP-4-dehydrorhamnose reductase